MNVQQKIVNEVLSRPVLGNPFPHHNRIALQFAMRARAVVAVYVARAVLAFATVSAAASAACVTFDCCPVIRVSSAGGPAEEYQRDRLGRYS